MVILPPIKPPTRMEWAVIFWLMIVVLVIAGSLYLYFGISPPADMEDASGTLIRRGLLFVGTAIGAILLRWAARRWINR